MSAFATVSNASVLPTFLSAAINSGQISLQERKTAVLRHIAQSERLTAVRPASRLEVRPQPEMISTGIAELDGLAGGLPRGCLTEVCGTASSGKTSVLLAALATATQNGESCVLIDGSDSFDPSSGATAGVNFRNLLWVRCGAASRVVRRTSSAKNLPFVGTRSSAKNQGHRVPHPTRFSLGGEFDFAEDERRTTNDDDDFQRFRTNHETRLGQVLKSTDLILQSGGFGLVTLDLAGIPDKFVRRIPLASWFRFARAVEHTKTALLVISETPCAQTCAALVMNVCSQPIAICSPSGKPSHAQVLRELQIEANLVRSRLRQNQNRKPMHSVKTTFMTQAVRAG